MIQGTTPIIYVAFGVEIESLQDFKIIFEQDGKDNLVKSRNECVIDTKTNVAYTKLTQEETLEFDTRKAVRVQAKALTIDGNVIASGISKETVCPILDETPYENASNDITPIDTNAIHLDFLNSNCGFALDFGDMIVYQQIPADKELSSTSTNALENRVITENIARIDNEFIETENRIDEVEILARGATQGKSFLDYAEMVADLNNATKEQYKINQHLLIKTIGVPDLWIYGISNTKVPYVYTTDEALAETLKTSVVQIGYYIVSPLETQKVDLVDYAKKSQVPVITATKKENGAYTLTITMGVD